MKLKDIIEETIPGDWGNEDYSDITPCEVYCIRGADIVSIGNDRYNEIPLRFISEKANNKKILKSGDLIIEKSGGSPSQSTGRIIYVSQVLIEAKMKVICSNFCIALRLKSGWNPKFVYYYWKYLYNLGVFFNFEGKTSGIKNLQLDNVLSSIDIPDYNYMQQIKIAEILSKIENKISINHQINRNLPHAA